MSYIYLSNVIGKIPTVAQLTLSESKLGYNIADGLFYALKIQNGVKEVICIGGGNDIVETHSRAHSLISELDHLPVEPGDEGKIPQADPLTRKWKLVPMPVSAVQQQSDWNQEDEEALDFIRNKPSEGGDGTVTSVGLEMPSMFSVSDSPVTTFGVLKVDINTVPARTFLAGATLAGGWAKPVFRTIELSDLPAMPASDFHSWDISINSDAPLQIHRTGSAETYKGLNLVAGEGIEISGQSGIDDSYRVTIAATVADTSVDVYIKFEDAIAFTYTCPYPMKFTGMEYQMANAPALSVALNTDMTKYQSLIITPDAVGLVILKGVWL
jgi:hypothetical protein